MRGIWALSFALLVGVGFGCESSGKKSAPVPSPEQAPVAAKPAERSSAAVGPVGEKPAASAPKQVEAPPAPPDPIAALFPVKYTPSETLPDKMRRRIRFRLRDKSQAAIALHHIIDIPKPDGSREVFALYEYSVYEDCVHGYATRKEGREHCLVEPGTIPINRAGVALGAVRALFGPPEATTPADAGGSLTVWSMAFKDGLCDVDQYHHLFVADVDSDDKLEMYADITTSCTEANYDVRTPRMTLPHEFRQHLYVFSGDAADTALALALDSHSSSDWGSDRDRVHEELIALLDINHDGHLDVIQTKPCFKEGSREPCDWEPREKVAYVYDADDDMWRERSAPASEPATQP